jgi:hypothetical protein
VLVGAEGEAGRVLRHDDRGNASRPVVARAHHRDVDVAVAGAGDELLGAGEHIIVAVAHGPCLERRRVGAGAGLGQAVARQPFHRRQLRHEALPLLVAAETVDHPRRHIVDRDEAGEARAGLGQRLEHQHRVQAPERGAAEIVADIDAAQAERTRLAYHGGGEELAFVPVERVRRDASFGEGLRRVADRALVLGELELAGAGIDCRIHGVSPRELSSSPEI